MLYGEFGGRGVLLTGRGWRAGARCVQQPFAELLGIDLPSKLRLLQAPKMLRKPGPCVHRRNSLLDRIVGRNKPPSERKYTKSAFVSISTEARQRVSRALAEALNRRGAASFATQGLSLHHRYEMPDRGWYWAKPSLLKI